jgi:cell division transport system permease protein
MWIYLPFLLQGLTFGLLGGGIAIGFMAIARHFMAQLLISQPAFLQSLAQNLQLSAAQGALLTLALIGFGSFVGLSGSFMAVRRFLIR